MTEDKELRFLTTLLPCAEVELIRRYVQEYAIRDKAFAHDAVHYMQLHCIGTDEMTCRERVRQLFHTRLVYCHERHDYVRTDWERISYDMEDLLHALNMCEAGVQAELGGAVASEFFRQLENASYDDLYEYVYEGFLSVAEKYNAFLLKLVQADTTPAERKRWLLTEIEAISRLPKWAKEDLFALKKLAEEMALFVPADAEQKDELTQS